MRGEELGLQQARRLDDAEADRIDQSFPPSTTVIQSEGSDHDREQQRHDDDEQQHALASGPVEE